MKSLLAIFGIMILLSPVSAMAAACSTYGVNVDTICDDNSEVTGSQRPFSTCSIDSSFCSYQECDGRCVCANNGVCPTSSGSSGCGSTTCDSNPTWTSTATRTGVQTGTVSLLNKKTCKCEDVTVKRCMAGFYVASVTGLSVDYFVPYVGYFANSVTCTACPKADGDTSLNMGAPSYVTSNPSAIRSFNGAGACQIKANTDIPDSTGTYQYSKPCTHENDGGGMITL